MRIAAHDLRNLLTVVSGFSQFGRSTSAPDKMVFALDRIEKASDSMQAIIDGFLCLQTVHGTNQGQRQVFDLGEVIQHILEQSAFSAQAKGIRLVKQLPPGALPSGGEPGAYAPDPHQLRHKCD